MLPTTEAWIKLPLELLRQHGISKSGAVLLAAIIDECKHSEDLAAPISVDKLIAKAGYSRATVFRTLDELRELGLIETERTGRACVYKLTAGCVELCPRAVKDDRPARHTARAGSKPAPRAAAAKYEAVVNRFPDDDPLPGQMEFTDEVSPVETPEPDADPWAGLSDNVRDWLAERRIAT